MEHPEASGATPPPAHAAARAARAARRMPPALAWRNWPVSWRLTAVVVVAVVLDGVLGGLRLAAAAGSTAQFDRVAQLAVLGQQVTGLAHAMEDERDQTAGFIAGGRPAAGLLAVRQDYAATDARARGNPVGSRGHRRRLPSRYPGQGHRRAQPDRRSRRAA